MKKKGLIISTVVMAVVLIASLTTATYAWFTASAQATVSAISIKMTSDSKVVIGVSKTNAIVASPIEENFLNGTLEYDSTAANKWSGGYDGLGSSIDTGLSLTSLTQAMFTGSGTGSSASAYTIDNSGSFNLSNVFIKTNGNSTTLGEASGYSFAYANNYKDGSTTKSGDYLDVTFGVRAAKENIKQIGLVIGFDTANTVNLGLCAAFNYWYETSSSLGGSAEETVTDIYSNHYADKITSMSAPKNTWTAAEWDSDDGLSWTPAAGDQTIILNVGGDNSTELDTTTIYQIHLVIFLNGWDTDCNNSAATAGIKDGTKIYLDFITR